MYDVAAKSAALRALLAQQIPTRPQNHICSGLMPLDDLAAYGGLRCGAIHELLFDSAVSPPKSLALLWARAAQAAGGGVIVWSDPKRELYPAAVSAAGVDLRRLILLRPQNAAQEISALAECLRCKGVSATVTTLDGGFAFGNQLSDIEARRLQLAAENGGGVGIFLRPILKGVKSEKGVKGVKSRGNVGGWISNYAAATRWMVRPVTESDAEGKTSAGAQIDETQCWNVQLLHGHGGQVGASVLLEVDRETNEMRTFALRASAPLADRPAATPPLRATA